jgi:hypothetical protein
MYNGLHAVFAWTMLVLTALLISCGGSTATRTANGAPAKDQGPSPTPVPSTSVASPASAVPQQNAAAPTAGTPKKSHRLSRVLTSVAAHAFRPLAKQVPEEYEYDEFFKAMNLDPEKQRRTKEILIDYRAAEAFVAVKGLLRGQHPGSGYKPKTTEERNELISDRDNKLAEILSPEELARLREYETPESTEQRRKTRMLDGMFPGLAPEKQAKAMQTIDEEVAREEKDTEDVLSDDEGMQRVQDRIRLRLGNDFTPEEMGIVERFMNLLSEYSRLSTSPREARAQESSK